MPTHDELEEMENDDSLDVAHDLLHTIDAIDALHRKVVHLLDGDMTICPTCDENTYGRWPCDTARLLHPEVTQ